MRPPAAATAASTPTLLVRRPPLPGESTGSWLTRVAHANGYTGYRQMGNDLGVCLPAGLQLDVPADPQALAERLAVFTRCGVSEVMGTLLSAQLEEMTGNPRGVMGRWVFKPPEGLGLGMAHAICPHCLAQDHLNPESFAQDRLAYWRRDWRLATTTVCTRHACVLLAACTHCARPFVLNGHRNQLDRCLCCGAFLRSMVAAHATIRPRRSRLPERGRTLISPVPVAHPKLFWDGIAVLLSVIRSPARAKKLAASPLLTRRDQRFMRDLAHKPLRDFERHDATTRHKLLQVIQSLLHTWPTRFVNVFKSARLTAASFAMCQLDIPYWLHQVVHVELNARHYRPSAAEADAVREAARRHGHLASPRPLARWIGMRQSKVFDIHCLCPHRSWSDMEAQKFTAWLGHAIAQTPCSRGQRATLIRDAAVIELAMLRGLSLSQAVRLPMAAGHPTQNEPAHAAGCPLLARYLCEVRPRWTSRRSRTSPLFVCRDGTAYTGGQLRERFTRLSRAAKMPASPPGRPLVRWRGQAMTEAPVPESTGASGQCRGTLVPEPPVR